MALDRRRGLAAAVALALALSAIPFLATLRVDNSLEVWLDRTGEPYREYREYLDLFGSEEFVLVAYPLPERLDLDLLLRLTDLGLDLEEVEGVRRIHCLSRVYSQLFGLRGLEAFEEEVRHSPFYRNFLVSGDGRWAGVWITLDLESAEGEASDAQTAATRRAVVEAVEAAVALYLPEMETHLAGSPVINVELDRASQRASRAFFPWVFGLSALVLGLLFRRPYGVLLPFLSVGSGIAATLGLLSATGHALNMVTVALPPLIWVLGLFTSIHLLSRTQQRMATGAERGAAIREALTELWWPCLVSALTTALGFVSLIAATMEPVREMGMFSAAGIIICLATNFLLFPLLARLLRVDAGARRTMTAASPGAGARFLARLGGWVCRWPLPVLAVTLALVAAFLVSALRIRAEANVIEFFRDDAPVAVTYRQVLAEFTGPYSLEILLDLDAQELEREPSLEDLRRLDALARELAALPGVARVFSAADLLAKAHQVTEDATPEGYRLPESPETLVSTWEAARELSGGDWGVFHHAESGTFRLSVLARPMGSEGHRRIVREVSEILARGPEAWRPRLTGIVPLLVETQTDLLESQIRSFALAFLIIFPALALLLRSLRDALLSLVPNLFPVLFALGAMGFLGIALDPATVMIAGVALGVAVNDTVHFLVSYRRGRQGGATVREAIVATFQAVGRPMVLTTLVASLGFFVLCLSEFVPLVHFGWLMGLTLGAALVGDLLALPALLALLGRFSGRKGALSK